MENSPLVCVCIPCYNAEKTILETLDSIRKQTYTNIEIHVFDNVSADRTVECIEALHDERIFLHIADATGTAEENFTRCLNLGRGGYTAIYHADDLYASNIVEKEVQFLEANEKASGALTFATQIDSQGNVLKTYLAPKSLSLQAGEAKAYGVAELMKAILAHDNFLFCPSAMIRTKVCVDVIKSWNGEQFKSSADLDVWLRLAAAGQLGLLNEPLLFYRISDEQWTADYRKHRKVRADTFLVLEHWLKNETVASRMTASDLGNYQQLQNYDALGCILNAMRMSDLELAHRLWQQASLSVTRMWWLTQSIRDMKFSVLAMLLWLMLLPMLGKVFRLSLLKCLDKVRL